MNFEELINRYKLWPMPSRILLALLIGLVPGIYMYFTDIDDLYAEKDQATQQRAEARQRYDEARQKLDRLPLLEEELATTEDELAKVSKKLPDRIQMDNLLESIAQFARKTGVEIQVFDPKDARPGRTNIRYMEVPISVSIRGRYPKILRFFDEIVHLEKLVQLSGFEFKLESEITKKREEITGRKFDTRTPLGQKANRAWIRVIASGEIIAFRSMSLKEEKVLIKETTTPDGIVPTDQATPPPGAPPNNPNVSDRQSYPIEDNQKISRTLDKPLLKNGKG